MKFSEIPDTFCMTCGAKCDLVPDWETPTFSSTTGEKTVRVRVRCPHNNWRSLHTHRFFGLSNEDPSTNSYWTPRWFATDDMPPPPTKQPNQQQPPMKSIAIYSSAGFVAGAVAILILPWTLFATVVVNALVIAYVAHRLSK